GGLLGLSWTPGSATSASGDLFSINVGPNGTIGNFINLLDDGLSVFSVSQSMITANVPVAFNAPGDRNFGNGLYFSNSTQASVTSAAPMLIQAGEVFNSSNLTLKTFNSGSLVLDSQTIRALGVTVIGGGANTITLSENGVVLSGTARPTK